MDSSPPDKTIYLGFDMMFKQHPEFFHPKYYNMSSIMALDGPHKNPYDDKDSTVYGWPETPQWDNITFMVYSYAVFKAITFY